ncbi:four helix bundle protein [soil metagenome]
MKDYKKLIVWQKSHTNAVMIYDLTKSFPKEERFGVTSQIRRAAVSVPTNIAEGCGKFTQPDLAKYLQIAFGSAQELEYLMCLSCELEFLNKEDYDKINKLINEVKAMLISLLAKVRTK